MTAPARTVNVTREHIAKGEPCMCSRCPVALALLAAIPAADEAIVYLLDDTCGGGAEGTVWATGGYQLRLTLPPEVKDFILAFDGGGSASPFSFEAEVTRL